MKCPVDGATLVMSERQNIEIDYCPECRGVWLDRGELDKIIERADQDRTGPARAASGARPAAPGNRSTSRRPRRRPAAGLALRLRSAPGDRLGRQKKKKKNFLSELFDD